MHALPPAGKCAVQFFFSEADLDYFLDDKPIGHMPLVVYWAPSNTRVFSKALISEGEHKLTVTAWAKSRDFHRTFLCEPGTIYYVYPQLELIITRDWRGITSQYSGEIAVYSEPLESHDGWRRLIFYNGKWFDDD